MIRLSPVAEPEIYTATHRFGTVLENVALEPSTRALDLDDESLVRKAQSRPNIVGQDLVREVMPAKPFAW